MASYRLQSYQVKAVMTAVGASAIAAVAMMFVPVGLLETITGATGISEMVPATAAPLGDTARALMAFVVGAVALVAVLALLLRREKAAVQSTNATQPDADYAQSNPSVSLMERVATIGLPRLRLPKMPWVKNDGDILDLADLPKLKVFDAHPDAPARRPLSASSDLVETIMPAVADLRAAPTEAPEPSLLAEPVAVLDEPIVPSPMNKAPPSLSTTASAIEATVGEDAQPSLAEMVAQLEAAVIARKQQLAELEVVAADLAASNGQSSHLPKTVIPKIIQAPLEAEILPPEKVRYERPTLEAVPSTKPAACDDDMDAALRAALDTLQRMNVRTG